MEEVLGKRGVDQIPNQGANSLFMFSRSELDSLFVYYNSTHLDLNTSAVLPGVSVMRLLHFITRANLSSNDSPALE